MRILCKARIGVNMEAFQIFMQIGRAILDAFGITNMIVSAFSAALFLWLFKMAKDIWGK